ncbi:MAG: DNA mismatch repair protein MutS [Cellulosilyticaceae bacterium]
MNVTPMMRQYLDLKEQYKDCILFFRLGDFYEMFFEDALTASRELEITLTGRDCGLPERAPMCGIPFHAAENYISRLVEKGYKVAIGEQVEEVGASKGIVKRDVVRVVTPGTILEGNTIQEGKNNYITSIVLQSDCYGLSLCDVTTGEWQMTELTGSDKERKLLDELAKIAPVECMLNASAYEEEKVLDFLKNRMTCLVQRIPDHALDEVLANELLLQHFNVMALDGMGLHQYPVGTLAASALLGYLKDTQKNTLAHMNRIQLYNVNAYMLLDMATRRNLELTETLREKKRRGSLLWVLDHTKTAMGARYLRKCIEQPLVDAQAINARLDATTELKDDLFFREELREQLSQIYDIERLVGKIAYGTCNAKELIALKQSIGVLPAIYKLLASAQATSLKELYKTFDTLGDLYECIDGAIADEPPISVREGGLIKDGYHEEVDQLRDVKAHGANWLLDIEMKEKEKTGIKNLKIKYNKVFGYFLEVTHSYNHLVPDYFIRKQTLSNCERYITEELKTIEEQVLGADEKLQVLEYTLFTGVRDFIASHMPRLLSVSECISQLDMLASLADVAEKNNYIRPRIDTSDTVHIIDGRHPVVEKMMGSHQFIGNDVRLDTGENQINLITGPNMAGKSTYMRQVALLVLMAQMGSFIPAESAHIGVVDRIFTRVGASDDLASGQSTFMVEMMEVSNILNHATKQSLLILDEIGRGTSTIDGLSIAWAITEYIANRDVLGAKTLFATHYHELTSLEETTEGLKNYCVTVKEVGEDIIFLRKIARGSVDHSYGIQVAKLAGLPPVVLNRAKAIMQTIEKGDSDAIRHLISEEGTKTQAAPVQATPVKVEAPTVQPEVSRPNQVAEAQLSLFANPHSDVVKMLKEMDLMNMTPLSAMQMLYDLQQKVK